MMKDHVEELDNDCTRVITSSSHFRTDMKSIPFEPGNKHYVDKWPTEPLAKFENQESGNIFGQLLKAWLEILFLWFQPPRLLYYQT